MDHCPKLSVGLPVFNGERYLRAAIESILQQENADFELIISDNASEDRTKEICEEFVARDNRVRYHRAGVNQGAAWNFANVVHLGRGKYFKWAAYDDICLPGFFQRCIEALDRAPASVVATVPKAEVIDQSGKMKLMPISPESSVIAGEKPHHRLAAVLKTVSWAPAQYGVIRRDALLKTRLIEPFFASDRVLMGELAILGEICEIPEVLLQLRFHSEASTVLHRSRKSFSAWFSANRKQMLGFVPKYWRVGIEYFRSVWRMPMKPAERLACIQTLIRVWGGRELRRVFREIRNTAAIGTRVRKVLHRSTPGNREQKAQA